MRVFMTLQPDGVNVLGFYTDDIFGEYPNDGYPTGVIEITPEQWQDYRDNQGFRRWDKEAGTFVAYVPDQAPPTPDVISDRQCFQQLAALGKISQDDALAAVTVGALPKAVTDGIASLPADQQFPAKMLLCGATEFHRLHPMAPTFLGFFGLNATTDRDSLWTAAAQL